MIRLTTILFTVAMLSQTAFGDVMQLTLNTTTLVGNASGPFTIDFQFIDGDSTGDGNNSVTLSNFLAGGGSITSTPAFSTGGVSVTSSPFGATLTDTSFFNELQFAFTPGSSLSFRYAITANQDTTGPDTFTFAILDHSGNELPTDNPNGFNSFLEVDLPTTGSGTATTPSASAAFGISDPTVTPVTSAVPEPSSVVLLSAVVALAGFLHRSGFARSPKGGR
jgi:hypothetical protein